AEGLDFDRVQIELDTIVSKTQKNLEK
ncbi:MAG: hypothetical protein RIS68_192, partial [Bacteroidota bacterium]